MKKGSLLFMLSMVSMLIPNLLASQGENGCTTRPGYNNGTCYTSHSGGIERYYCLDSIWKHCVISEVDEG